jgi:putative flippase GtrA
MNKTLLRYFIIGLSTVLIDFSLLFILSEFSIDRSIANIFTVTTSIVFNFLMQNYWTFKVGSRNNVIKSFKYLLLTSFNYVFNISAFYIIFNKLDFETLLFTNFDLFFSFIPEGLITKLLISGLIMCWNYFLFKHWVFKKKDKQNESK